MTLDAASNLLICPVCTRTSSSADGEGAHLESPLDVSARPVRCPSGHSFDVAKQGYLNLLAGPPPRNADTADMIAARDRFLGSGAYAPIAQAAARAVVSRSAAGGVVTDAGAGTGYYLSACLDALPDGRGVALDVSVPAARRAARAHPRGAAIVADTWAGMPLATRAADAVLCVFAPRNFAEFARVLRPGGVLVVVTPEPDHLASLRAGYGLLDLEPDKAERLHAQARAAGFEAVVAEALDFTFEATAQQVADLIAMGPNAFHGAAGSQAMTLHAAVLVSSFERDRRPSR